MRVAALALLLAAAACESSKSKLDEVPKPAASAGSSRAVACPDAEMRSWVDTSVARSKRYFDALEVRASTWTADCEVARKDLLELEVEGERFVKDMTEASKWAKALPAECRDGMKLAGEAHPTTTEIQAKTPALEAKVKAVLEACQEHPGFKDASQRGLRLLKKKR